MCLSQQFQVAGDGLRLAVDKFPLCAGKGHIWKLLGFAHISGILLIVSGYRTIRDPLSTGNSRSAIVVKLAKCFQQLGGSYEP